MKPKKGDIIIFKASQKKPYVGTARIKKVRKNWFECVIIGFANGEIGDVFCVNRDEIISCMTEKEWQSLG